MLCLGACDVNGTASLTELGRGVGVGGAVGTRVGSGVALVTVVVLANHLGGDGYGRYTTLVAYSALVSVVADLGLNTLYTREAARDPARLARFLTTLVTGKLALSVAAALLLAGALAFA